MKKTILSMLLAALCFSIANAQLLVDENGKVGVGIETDDTLKSKFSINDEGNDYATAYIKSDGEERYGLYISGKNNNDRPFYGLRIISSSPVLNDSFVYGIHSSVSTCINASYTVGVYGTSGKSENKRNFGIAGLLPSSSSIEINGAAVYGSCSTSTTALPEINGRYAGYFYGGVRVIGTMTAGAFVTSSDYRLKENIRSLSSSDGCLSKLMSMNVVEFNNKQREYETTSNDSVLDDELIAVDDTLQTATLSLRDDKEKGKIRWFEEDSPIIKNKHYGLVAQELQKIYPDLVVESQDGYLAINYLEIIPLLIRSVQELKAELDATKKSNAPVQKAPSTRGTTDATDIDAVVTALYQNTPNPFTESTLIRCDVAEDVVKADLYIYNMNGEQITEYAVVERGATSITIDGGSLSAGMYLYALIADGQVIDTKRMILTK